MVDLNAIKPILETAARLADQSQNNLGTNNELAAAQAQQATATALIAATMALAAIAEVLQQDVVHVQKVS